MKGLMFFGAVLIAALAVTSATINFRDIFNFGEKKGTAGKFYLIKFSLSFLIFTILFFHSLLCLG